MTKEDRIFKQAEGISFIEVDDGCILYRDEDMTAHSLNQTASFVWVMCDGKHSIDQICDGLKAAFNIEDIDVVTMVEGIIKDFLERNLVE